MASQNSELSDFSGNDSEATTLRLGEVEGLKRRVSVLEKDVEMQATEMNLLKMQMRTKAEQEDCSHRVEMQALEIMILKMKMRVTMLDTEISQRDIKRTKTEQEDCSRRVHAVRDLLESRCPNPDNVD